MLTTRTKIALARIAYKGVAIARRSIGLRAEVVVTRDGLKWRLDLHEGIDFSIYLLGMFERTTVMAYRRLLKPGDVVLDIGANIGAHTLQLARCVGPTGRVIAFEPADVAFQKLVANITLNPSLAQRILPEQVMLLDVPDAKRQTLLYSSWPLTSGGDLHPKHRGRLMETTRARATSLDDYLERSNITQVNFVKMDVDGHECHVLRGADATLKRHKPTIALELAPYLHSETGRSLEELLDILGHVGYQLADESTGAPLPADPGRLHALIPDGASINVIGTIRPSEESGRQ